MLCITSGASGIIQSDEELTSAYTWQISYAAWRRAQIKTPVLCINDRNYLLENWRVSDPCKLYHKKTTNNDVGFKCLQATTSILEMDEQPQTGYEVPLLLTFLLRFLYVWHCKWFTICIKVWRGFILLTIHAITYISVHTINVLTIQVHRVKGPVTSVILCPICSPNYKSVQTFSAFCKKWYLKIAANIRDPLNKLFQCWNIQCSAIITCTLPFSLASIIYCKNNFDTLNKHLENLIAVSNLICVNGQGLVSCLSWSNCQCRTTGDGTNSLSYSPE